MKSQFIPGPKAEGNTHKVTAQQALSFFFHFRILNQDPEVSQCMDSIGGVSFPLIPELPLRRGCDLFAYNWDNNGPDSSGSLGMVADVTIKNLDFSLMLNSSSTWLKTHDDF